MKISCDVITDLIPLVKDDVASEDSRNLVLEHINACETCKMELENYKLSGQDGLDDKKIIASIKRSIIIMRLSLLVIGSIIGVALSNSFGMFYNFIIMPVVGVLGYISLKKKWYLAPLGVFILSYLWLFIYGIRDGGFVIDVLYYPIYFSSIYTFLVLLGVFISKLLNFAFRKEV